MRDIFVKTLIDLAKKDRNIELVTGDLGFVADYLNEGSFERRKGQEIIHLEALCDMMEAVTGDARFTEQVRELMEKKKGKKIKEKLL